MNEKDGMGKREQYRTVRREASVELVIRRSRFIGHVAPVETEEEAQAFVERVRKNHSMATHNCYAYRVGDRDQWQKSSDDGEPAGTAGKPILEVIAHRGLSNVAIVVTRYFGGVLLGAGGLIRAYTDAAAEAVKAGQPALMSLHQAVWADIDYTWYGKLENELRTAGVLVGETRFTDRVSIECLFPFGETEARKNWLIDLTQGQAVLTSGEARYIALPLPEEAG
jgi:uncharacterized YigZ family protein